MRIKYLVPLVDMSEMLYCLQKIFADLDNFNNLKKRLVDEECAVIMLGFSERFFKEWILSHKNSYIKR